MTKEQKVNTVSLLERYSGTSRLRKEDRITTIVIHHDAGRRPSTPEKVIPRLDSYDRQHDDTGGFPYHYVIDPWGKVYKCRKTTEITAHARGGNTTGLGVMLMGYFHRDKNYAGEKPTAAQIKSLKLLVAEIRQNVPSITKVLAHKDVLGSRTACPGNLFDYGVIAALNEA